MIFLSLLKRLLYIVSFLCYLVCMAKEIINDILLENDKEAQKLIDDALTCSAEMEMSEITELILGFFRNLPNFEMFKNYVRNFDKDQKVDLDEFLADTALSLVATFMGNYASREKPIGKA